MSSKKIFTVFGATGNQGGSVIAQVLDSPVLRDYYQLRGITRDTNKPKSKSLEAKGVQMVAADLNQPDSVAAAIKGSAVVFGMTNFWESKSSTVEKKQGFAMVDACVAAKVELFIWSSLYNATEISNGRITTVHHFDGKADIEKYARQKAPQLTSTFFMPGYFMTNMLSSIVKDTESSEERYVIRFPWDPEKTRVPMFYPGDTGIYVAALLRQAAKDKSYEKIANQHWYGATDFMTPNEIAAAAQKASGKTVVFQQVSSEIFSRFLPGEIRDELTGNMDLIRDPGYYGPYSEAAPKLMKFHKIMASQEPALPPLTTLQDFFNTHLKL